MDLLSIWWRRPRRSQVVPEHNQYPATPAVQDPYPGWTVHFEQTKNATNRRSKQTDLTVFPATPAGYYSGYYPGSGLAVSNRIADKRRHQDLPELNTYPAAPAPDQPLTGWIVHFEPIKNATNRRILSVELNTYPVTPVASVNDFYPGSQLITSNRISFKQTAQLVPELNTRPLAATPATLPAYLEWETFRHKSHYELLTVPIHNEYPETPPEIPAERVGSMLAAKHVRRVMRRGR